MSWQSILTLTNEILNAEVTSRDSDVYRYNYVIASKNSVDKLEHLLKQEGIDVDSFLNNCNTEVSVSRESKLVNLTVALLEHRGLIVENTLSPHIKRGFEIFDTYLDRLGGRVLENLDQFHTLVMGLLEFGEVETLNPGQFNTLKTDVSTLCFAAIFYYERFVIDEVNKDSEEEETINPVHAGLTASKTLNSIFTGEIESYMKFIGDYTDLLKYVHYIFIGYMRYRQISGLVPKLLALETPAPLKEKHVLRFWVKHDLNEHASIEDVEKLKRQVPNVLDFFKDVLNVYRDNYACHFAEFSIGEVHTNYDINAYNPSDYGKPMHVTVNLVDLKEGTSILEVMNNSHADLADSDFCKPYEFSAITEDTQPDVILFTIKYRVVTGKSNRVIKHSFMCINYENIRIKTTEATFKAC